jgi:hypothetical protein
LGPGQLEYDGGMARTDAERERLKQWALNWRPQPTQGRLNRYTRLKGGWSEYHKNRLVLRLTPEEREKAESIFFYLTKKHEWKVRSRPGYYRILWACAVSRCRKRTPQRYEHLSVVKRLDYWYDLAQKEGLRPVIPSMEKRRSLLTESSSAKSLEIDNLLTDLERSFR